MFTRHFTRAPAKLSRRCGAGYRVAVCTNKPEGLARLLLQRLGMTAAFGEALIGADTLAVRKPHPEALREAVRRAGGDPARALLVGDTRTDRETSRAAGVPSVLVGFGPGAGEVAGLDPEAVLMHYDDLPGIVQRSDRLKRVHAPGSGGAQRGIVNPENPGQRH